MTTKTFHSYPFSTIPEDGKPVTDADLHAALHPLLEGLYHVVTLVAEGKQDDPEMHPTLTLLSSLIGLGDEVLERWHTDKNAAHRTEKQKPH
ncbi:MAG TPA: hypothetical protein VLQ80_25870 [Candidatus Saccharimonadia bacterium]|nr:hypothetical protein [Candidatus Saccharimonadia bacterium]